MLSFKIYYYHHIQHFNLINIFTTVYQNNLLIIYQFIYLQDFKIE